MYNSGGMERVLANKANYLSHAKGVDGKSNKVIIITTDQKNRKPFFYLFEDVRCIDLGINYEDDAQLPLPFRLFATKKKKAIHRMRLRDVLLKEKADIVISMFDYDFDILCDVEDGSSKILEYHFSREAKMIEARSWLKRTIQSMRLKSWLKIIRKYDKLGVLTERDKRSWGDVPNIMVIPNYLPTFPDKLAPLNNKIVLSVGRLSYQKNFHLLIRAWSKVHIKCPDWRLVIRGNGDDKDSIIQLIDKLSLSESVSLLPSTSQIASEYLNASFLAMSSRYEGFPMVMLEAMAHGLPIVTVDYPCGASDVITNGLNGIVVGSSDSLGLANAIITLINDNANLRKMSVSARHKAEEYTESRVMGIWQNLFREISSKS